MSDNDPWLTNLLRAARTEKHLSRRVIAELAGISESAVWRLERRGTGTQGEIDAVAAALTAFGLHATTYGSVSETSTTAVSPTASTDGVSTPSEPSTPPPAPAELQTDTVAWSGLLSAARRVSEHDLERAQFTGPSRERGTLPLSNSELQTFKTCRRKWWLAYYRELAPRTESPVGALAIGNRIHRALRQFYVMSGLPREDPRIAIERYVAEDWTTLLRHHGADSPYVANIQQQFNLEADLERTIIAGYAQWLVDTGADANYEVTHAETYLEYDITDEPDWYGPPTSLIGKLDVRVRRRSDGVRLFIDHKTAADIGKVRLSALQSEQLLHYMLLEQLTSHSTEERCDGAILNVLKKTKRTRAARPPFYDRIEVRHSQVELDNFRRRLLSSARDIHALRDKLDAGAYHQDVVSMRPSGDCYWSCPFSHVCPMFDDGSRAEDMLSRWFERRDPLAYYQDNTANVDPIELSEELT